MTSRYLQLAEAGHYDASRAVPPCGTWSQVHVRAGGPRPVRFRHQLWSTSAASAITWRALSRARPAPGITSITHQRLEVHSGRDAERGTRQAILIPSGVRHRPQTQRKARAGAEGVERKHQYAHTFTDTSRTPSAGRLSTQGAGFSCCGHGRLCRDIRPDKKCSTTTASTKTS